MKHSLPSSATPLSPSSVSSFPCSHSALSDVYLWGCYGYESGAHRRRPPRAAGCFPSSYPPLSLGRVPSLGLCRRLARPARRSPPPPPPRRRHPSPAPSAALSAPPPASSRPPPAAPCAFVRAPSAAPCGPKASAPPGGHRAECWRTRRLTEEFWTGGEETDLLLGEGEPVDTRSRFGLQEQVVEQFHRRLVSFLCRWKQKKRGDFFKQRKQIKDEI